VSDRPETLDDPGWEVVHEDYCSYPDECACRKMRRISRCNGICITGAEVIVGQHGIVIAHPECPAHGHLARYEVDGTPRAAVDSKDP
jgi:hypothetical protein